MNRLLLLFLVFLSFSTISAQELLDDKISISCEEIAASNQRIISSINSNDSEKIRKILGEWEEKCGLVEPIYRLRLLLDIKEGRAVHIFQTDEFKYYFNEYECKTRASKKQYSRACNQRELRYGYIPVDSSFDSLTRHISNELLINHDSLGIAENAICFHYYNQFSSSYQYIYELKKSTNPAVEEGSTSCENHVMSMWNVIVIAPKIELQTYFGNIQTYMKQSIFLGGNIGLDINNVKLYGNLGALINLGQDSFSVRYDNQTQHISNKIGFVTGGGFSTPVYKKNTNFFIYSNIEASAISYLDGKIKGYILNTGLVLNWKIKRRCRYLGITLAYQYIDYQQSKDLLEQKINGHALSIGLIWSFKNRRKFFVTRFNEKLW